MKKIFTLIAAVVLTTSVFAQSPEKMSYQAVVRNTSDNLVTNQSVGMQISILQGSAGGTAVYVETQTPTTNTNGLVTIEIGNGTVVTGDFATIDWTNGPYFIKTETDPAGGANYTITGTSQLLSVPYALHAKTAESVTGTITETDPVFGSSLASGITAADTANWNNHTIDTDTQLDSTGVASLGYVAGAHTTDTQLDSTGVASLGFVAGAHTVDTDTQLDSTGVAALGYVAGAHTIEVDADTTNELQVLSISNDTLYLSNGGTVYLGNYLDNTDDQTLTLNADTLSIEDGNYVDLSIYLDDQTVTITAGEGITVTGTYPDFTVTKTPYTGSIYRWTSFSTYNQAFGWYANNDPNMYGGIAPQVWSDANGIASNMSPDKQVLLTLFNKKAYPGNNAVVFANEWYSFSSTNGQFAGALFRIENTTGSDIVWNVEWFSTAYWGWGERSSVTINGANTWNSGGSSFGANHHESTVISIPANRVSTIIFIAGSSPPSSSSRGTYLAFDQNCLNLPFGLIFVDDLDTAPNGWGF